MGTKSSPTSKFRVVCIAYSILKFQSNLCPVYSSPQENAWIWETSNGRFYYEYKEHVRFRVESEVWCDQIPEKPRLTEDGDIVTDPLDKKVPYTVIVSSTRLATNSYSDSSGLLTNLKGLYGY